MRHIGAAALLYSAIGAFDHRLQQDLAARADIGLGGVLDLVVADAVLAGHEDHGGRRPARDVAGVVARAPPDVPVRGARPLRAAPPRADPGPGGGRRRGAPEPRGPRRA